MTIRPASPSSKTRSKSRQAFVDSAAAALGSTEAAEALANQIGLIPAAARTIFETNAKGVQAEMITLGEQVKAVPDAKQITVDALSDKAKANLEALGFQVTTLPNGQVQIDVHDEAGRAKLQAFLAFSSTQVGTMLLDANPALAQGKVTSTITFANGQTGTVTIDGNTAPVDGKIKGSVTLADGSKGTITIDGNQTPVNGKIKATVDYGNGQHTVITLDPKDLVTGKIDSIPKTGKTIWTIEYRQVTVGAAPAGAVGGSIGGGGSSFSGSVGAIGGIVQPMADGGVLGMANGGHIRHLRPMSGGIAQIVPPNTWRVIGDRLRDDEAFIPLNKHLRRSHAILGRAADRLGYGLVPRAASRYLQAGLAGRAGITRDELLGGPRVIGSVVTPAAGSANAAIAAAIGSLRSELRSVAAAGVTRADVRDLVAAVRAARPITVEDRSGNPVETARAAQLAGRFSA